MDEDGSRLTTQLEIIHDYIDQRAMHRVTWIVIWLIVVAILVACVSPSQLSKPAKADITKGEVAARLIFHAIPRDEGEFMMVKGVKGLLEYQ